MKSILFVLSILSMATSASASPVNGKLVFHDTLAPNMREDFDIALKANSLTFIRVDGDGRSDIDCTLFDSNGHVVDFDNTNSPSCAMVFNPPAEGRYDLRVMNVGEKMTTFKGAAY